MKVPPLVERGLQISFDAVPRRTVVVYDWDSEEGKRFLQYVDAAVAGGTDVNRIGALLGIPNFGLRYKMLSKRERL